MPHGRHEERVRRGGDMVDELVLEYNKARQAAITREIAEISAGTAAVS